MLELCKIWAVEELLGLEFYSYCRKAAFGSVCMKQFNMSR